MEFSDFKELSLGDIVEVEYKNRADHGKVSRLVGYVAGIDSGCLRLTNYDIMAESGPWGATRMNQKLSRIQKYTIVRKNGE